MLTINEFQQYVADHVKEHLPEELRDAEIQQKLITKPNTGTLHAVSCRKGGDIVAPTVYVDRAYDAYREGTGTPEDFTKEFSKMILTGYEEQPGLDGSSIREMNDPDFVRSHVVMRLINTEKNRELLATVPHREFEDLSVIYTVLLRAEKDELATCILQKEHAERLGLTDEEIDRCAMRNTKELLPVTVRSLESVLQGLSGEAGTDFDQETPPGAELYVVSNQTGVYGASSVLYDEPLAEIAETIGGDLFILPSSVHEVLAVAAEDKDVRELAEMVQSINRSDVQPEEVLSDHVYRYNADAHRLTLADTTAEELQKQEEEGRKQEGTAQRQRMHR